MIRYLSRPEVAVRIGVQPDTLNRYRLPEPDAQIGARQVGWLPETIDAWNAARPSKRSRCDCPPASVISDGPSVDCPVHGVDSGRAEP